MRHSLAVMAALGLGTALAAMPLVAASGRLAASAPLPRAVSTLELGLWELRSSQPGSPPTKLCVRDVRQLFQPHHPAQQCHQFVSQDAADHVAVSYDCGQHGQGRTDLRVETSRLIQIDTQGVADGRPFEQRLEGRRIGTCAPSAKSEHANSAARASAKQGHAHRGS